MALRPDQIPLILLLGGLAYLLLHEVWLLRSSFRERFAPWALAWTVVAIVFLLARWVQRASLTPEPAVFAVRAQLALTLVIGYLGVGALRAFTDRAAGTRGMAVGGLAALILVTLTLATPWFVPDEQWMREDVFGVRYYTGRTSPWVLVYVAYGIALSGYAIRLIRTAGEGGRTPRWSFQAAAGAMLLFGVNDVLFSLGVIQSMHLFEYGFFLIAVASGHYLQRRVDAIHDHLEDAVTARTSELEIQRSVLERTLDELERSQARLRELHDASLEAVVFVDTEGCILDANAALERMFAAPADELRGAELASLFASEAASRLAALVAGEAKGVTELEAKRSDGSRIAVEVATSPRHANEIAAIVIRDVTQQRALQARLQRADRLASLGMLAAGTAHEINNPLTYVITNAELLDEELERSDGVRLPETRQLVADIRMGAERVRRIVRDLSAFARERPTESAPLDIRGVLDASLELAGNELRHRARVVREYQDVSPVFGSEMRLGQAFLNLLVNAAHAIPEGRIGANEIRVVVREVDGMVVVEIRDTGLGMDEATRERIFDPFFTTKKLGHGTGLGLSICHGVISSLGGRLEVESELGAGSTFSVYLPAIAYRTPEARAVAISSVRPPAPAGRARVLVVDDEAGVARGFRRALHAHDVTLALSGREALERCASHDFDLVVCDLMMPDLTGMDVFEQLGKTRPDLAARMIFVTGGVFTEAARAFLRDVDNLCLEKPVDVEQLRAVAASRARPSP